MIDTDHSISHGYDTKSMLTVSADIEYIAPSVSSSIVTQPIATDDRQSNDPLIDSTLSLSPATYEIRK